MVWFFGLIGSGKTTISLKTKSLLEKDGIETVYVSMDEIRKKIFPEPIYSDEERNTSYRSMVVMANYLSASGNNVILDGTAHKLVWRDFARKECEKYAEVYIKCPIEVCIDRENRREQDLVRKNIYRDALARQRSGNQISGFGKVPGIDEEFEESPYPELVIDCRDSDKADEMVLKMLRNKFPDSFL